MNNYKNDIIGIAKNAIWKVHMKPLFEQNSKTELI